MLKMYHAPRAASGRQTLASCVPSRKDSQNATRPRGCTAIASSSSPFVERVFGSRSGFRPGKLRSFSSLQNAPPRAMGPGRGPHARPGCKNVRSTISKGQSTSDPQRVVESSSPPSPVREAMTHQPVLPPGVARQRTRTGRRRGNPMKQQGGERLRGNAHTNKHQHPPAARAQKNGGIWIRESTQNRRRRAQH